jgi:transcriptional repressor NrdR
MKCPYCGGMSDKVVDSRSAAGGEAVRRRRECTSCGKRYTTYEYVENETLQVIKSDGRREDFNRAKVINGMVIACKKRPVGRDDIEQAADEIENRLFTESKGEVTTRRIGELVMNKLKEMDDVAYIRFASVYRNFRDRGEFIEELKDLATKMKVVKSSGEIEAFDRGKIVKGIKLACNKRPVTEIEIERIADEVISKLKPDEHGEINSKEIGAKVADKLRKVDEVAYVRFASVYRQFQDKNEFLDQIKDLLGDQ